MKIKDPYAVFIEFIYRDKDLTNLYGIARNWYLPTQIECYDYAKYWFNKTGAIDMKMIQEGKVSEVKDWLRSKGLYNEETETK